LIIRYFLNDQRQPLSIVVQSNDDSSSPTGLVAYCGKKFIIENNGRKRPSKLITVTENGTINAYNPHVNPTIAFIVASSPDAVYKGLAIIDDHLYVANFRSGMIEKYNFEFALI